VAFSLKYLFVFVTIAAIFTAAIIYKTQLWTLAAIYTTILVLLAGTLGLSTQRLRLKFWLAFCAVGWLYLAFSLTENCFASYVPSKRISYWLNRSDIEPLVKKISAFVSQAIRGLTVSQ
jgi:hypothetical protein